MYWKVHLLKNYGRMDGCSFAVWCSTTTEIVLGFPYLSYFGMVLFFCFCCPIFFSITCRCWFGHSKWANAVLSSRPSNPEGHASILLQYSNELQYGCYWAHLYWPSWQVLRVLLKSSQLFMNFYFLSWACLKVETTPSPDYAREQPILCNDSHIWIDWFSEIGSTSQIWCYFWTRSFVSNAVMDHCFCIGISNTYSTECLN